MRTLNLGILAHVDAGKTSLTERLLHLAGVIENVGSVDEGNTQTDSLELERQRGITIKSSVVSFTIDGVAVNLIDTPGHPDFIAEVERVLNVLDGAVLVVSAVEGVQAQTRVLMRTLRRLRIPVILFVNKVDRRGARHEELLREIADKLVPAIVPMGSVSALGDRSARFHPYGPGDTAFTNRLVEVLADNDDAVLAAYVEGRTELSHDWLRAKLTAQTRRALVHPVYFGSAITGAGVDALVGALTELLPTSEGDADGPVSGTVFKVERGPSGEKIAYARLYSGTIQVRDHVRFGKDKSGKVTLINVFDKGAARPGTTLPAGRIGKLWGLNEIRIGDSIGIPRPGTTDHRHFGPPTLEAVVTPRSPADTGPLYVALTHLAQQDPLINVRRDEVRNELSVSLYGEVQKEVIQATLADEYGIEVTFSETTTVCVERLAGTGAAVEIVKQNDNPFVATVGLQVQPAAPGTGVEFRLAVELGSLPLAFMRAIEESARATLRQGRYGWQVVDCTLTLTHSGYISLTSTAADFRHLTPLVLAEALQRAGTVVHEPMHRFHLDIPADTLGAVLPVLAKLRAIPGPPTVRRSSCTVEGHIPAAEVHRLQQQLPGLTHGEGILETSFDHYQPVTGAVPTRPRSDHNPFHRKEYLLHVLRRV